MSLGEISPRARVGVSKVTSTGGTITITPPAGSSQINLEAIGTAIDQLPSSSAVNASSTDIIAFEYQPTTTKATNQLTLGGLLGISPLKPAVNAVAVANIASLSGLTTVDSVSLVAGNYVLLTAQSTAAQNGIWQVNSGAWTRPYFYATGTPAILGTTSVALAGTLYSGTTWSVTSISGGTVVDTASTIWTLATTGTSAPAGAAAGSATGQLQWNNAGLLGASAGVVYTDATRSLAIGSGAVNGIVTTGTVGATSTGLTITIQGGAGGATSGAGGPALIKGGVPVSGAGGAVQLTGAAGVTSGAGGAVSATAGNGVGTGAGGSAQITAGNSTGTTGNGGAAVLKAGSAQTSTSGAGGALTLQSGSGANGASATGNGGNVGISSGTGGTAGGNGGSISATGGSAIGGTGTGGAVTLSGGASSVAAGGNVTLSAGPGIAQANDGTTVIASPTGGNAFQVDQYSNAINLQGSAITGKSVQAPTTGFAITIAAGITRLILNPAGTLASGTITMPAAPVDGQIVEISTTQTVTALTVSANTGQTISGAASTIVATAGLSWAYELSLTKWIRRF
jgi:hypothetical protein